MRIILFLAWAALLVAQPPQTTSLDQLPLVRVTPLSGETHHVQGMDTDGTVLWVTSVDRAASKGFLQEFAVGTGALLRTIELQDGVRYHPGGMAAGENSLWLPVAEYRRNSTAVIERRNRKTLELEFQFTVPDHIGCLAVTKDELIGGNWDSRIFYVWDHQGHLLRKVENPTPNGYQDLKFVGGLLVASGLLPGSNGAIDWLSYPSFALDHRMTAGRTDRQAPFTREAMTIFRNQLFLLPEDSPSRLFTFRLP